MGQSQEKFNAKTTSTEALDGCDMSGRVAIVTGANSGIGKEVSRVLAGAGATVILACRSVDRGNEAKFDILESIGQDRSDLLRVIKLDLSDLNSVRNFRDEFNAMNLPLHFLVANAGLFKTQYAETAQGFEVHFGIHHIGHMYMFLLLRPNLEDSAPSRVLVTTAETREGYTSLADWLKVLDGDTPRAPREDDGWAPMSSQGFSKLCNEVFARELDRRYHDVGISAVGVDPGRVQTNVTRHHEGCAGCLVRCFVRCCFRPVEVGAASHIRCLTLSDSEFVHGGVYLDCQPSFQVEVPNSWQDPEQTVDFRLWDLSERLIRGAGFEWDGVVGI